MFLTLLSASPYFQHKTQRKEGCQIDLLIQTKHTLYVCEIKFSKEPIGMNIIAEMKEKIGRLKIPKGFSIRPILIHVNGVTDALIESEFFASTINFSEFL